MPTLIDPGDPRNYTIGGSLFSFNGESLGNVVTATVTPNIEPLPLYQAELGYEAPDMEEDALSVSSSLVLDIVLDELTTNAFTLFLGGQEGLLDGNIRPMTRKSIVGSVVLEGVSVYGVNFKYTVPKARISPSAGMTYSSESWTTLSLQMVVYPSVDDPDNSFGVFEVIGVVD